MEPTWATKPLVDELNGIAARAEFSRLSARADELVSSNLTDLQKFRVIQTVILRHRDENAALPLIDRAHAELQTIPDYYRRFLSIYQMRLTGRSDFIAGLPDNERAIALEAERYFSAHPLEEAVQAARRLSEGGMPVAEVIDLICGSIASSRPLSLLRMGDGEGRFAYPLDSLPANSALAGETARRIWFWNSVRQPGVEFWDRLRDAYRRADIAGFNPERRIRFEGRNSIQGYIGVVNGNRFLEEHRERGNCANWIFSEFTDADYRRIFSLATTVHFIGPHPTIEEALKQFGAKKIRVHLVPSDNIVRSVVSRPHYPDVYRDLLSTIRRDPDGLWLVASGVYAKIYCQAIRDAGGIALDVGSLADKWMGQKTR